MLVSVASFDWGVAVTVAAPQRPREVSSPGSTEPIDRDELEALIEALIEEARQRARRRRRRYGAVALFVALVAGGVGLRFDHGGGATGCSPPRRARRVAQRPGSPRLGWRLGAFAWAIRGSRLRCRRGAQCRGRRLCRHRQWRLCEQERRPQLAQRRAGPFERRGGIERPTHLSRCRSACSGNGVCG